MKNNVFLTLSFCCYLLVFKCFLVHYIVSTNIFAVVPKVTAIESSKHGLTAEQAVMVMVLLTLSSIPTLLICLFANKL